MAYFVLKVPISLQKLGHNSVTTPEYNNAVWMHHAASDWCVGWSGKKRYSRRH